MITELLCKIPRRKKSLGIPTDIDQCLLGKPVLIHPGVHLGYDPHGPVAAAKRMMLEDLDTSRFTHNELVLLLTHATCLESGFIVIDSASGSRFDGFKFVEVDCRNPVAFITSFSYTLPGSISDDVKESVMLKFEIADNYINVAGFLAESKVRLLKVQIDKGKCFPKTAAFSEKGANEISIAIKDRFFLPLMMRFCERVGAEFKLNFTKVLPRDLKLRVVKLLDVQDIARLALVSKDMRDLCSDNEL